MVAEGEEIDPAATAPAQDDDFDIPGDGHGENVGADSMPDLSVEPEHDGLARTPEPPSPTVATTTITTTTTVYRPPRPRQVVAGPAAGPAAGPFHLPDTYGLKT